MPVYGKRTGQRQLLLLPIQMEMPSQNFKVKWFPKQHEFAPVLPISSVSSVPSVAEKVARLPVADKKRKITRLVLDFFPGKPGSLNNDINRNSLAQHRFRYLYRFLPFPFFFRILDSATLLLDICRTGHNPNHGWI